jgi:multidrug efflux pump subunit AcrB
LPVLLPEGGTVTLGKIASISIGNSPALGHHFFGEEPAVGLAIFKNGDGRLEQVMLQVNNLIAEVQKNNPKFKFYTSQDQSFLLEAGISNLKQDLIAGGVFTILLLFSLLGNWRLPLIISITIPVSLIMTFSLFKLFNLSFNIVSLSGLSLAVGCVVDNTIVVLNRVMQRHYQGMVISQASETGVKEMAIPVLSQVVTTVAVYLPLVFLSGMAGILLGEQGLALTIALTVSLAVAFILAPLIATNLFHSKATVASEDTRIYQWISKGYHQMISAVLRKPILFLCITMLFMPVGIFLLQYLPTTALPNIDIKDTRIVIDWENNVSVEGNKERTHRLLKWLKDKTLTQEADVAFGMYLGNILPTTQRSVVYFTCENAESRIVLDSCVKEYISKTFPRANVKIEPAPNPLFQLFENTGADVDIRLYPSTEDWISGDAMNHIEKLVSQPKFQLYELYPKIYAQKAYYLDIDETALHIYRVTKEEVIRACQEALGEMNIPFKQGNTLSITMMGADSNFKELLSWPLQSDKGGNYSLGNFVHFSLVVVPSIILADQQGVYFSLKMNRGQPPTQASIYPLPAEWNAAIHGSYVYNRKLLQQLELIFVIVIILIYITLAIQYENSVQPLIVMLSIPLGISGAVFLLWIFGFGLNVMTAAGFIVVLGLIVDDPILKVETLNRLAKYRFNHSLPLDAEAIGEMIHEAGHLCLKPLLLVSLTTSAALIPALIIPGFGNQLQKPMAVVIIGGLTIGTFFTTWFIPLAYWYMVKWKWIRFRFENK